MRITIYYEYLFSSDIMSADLLMNPNFWVMVGSIIVVVCGGLIALIIIYQKTKTRGQ